MNKKIIIIIIVLFIVIIAGAFITYSVITNQKTTFEEEEPFFSTIFPFGGGSREVTPDVTIVEEIIVDETGEAPKLRHVSSFPIAGMFSFVNDEDEELIRYVEKGTGHIYETKTNELGQEKISNTTIPSIYEAVWIDETSVILRYFNEKDELESFYAELTDGSLDGSFLEKNIRNITVESKTIRYFTDSLLIRSNPDGSNKTQLYNSSFGEWSLDWWNSSLAFLTTKPSVKVGGASFFLNTNSGNLTKIFSNISGLTILPNKENDNILFSVMSNNEPFLLIYDTRTDETYDAITQTLPEKCVWSGDLELYCAAPLNIEKALYPDDWYKGIISFSDGIWKVEVESGISQVIQRLENIDGINLTLSPSKDYLLFTNKKDSTLWSLRLED